MERELARRYLFRGLPRVSGQRRIPGRAPSPLAHLPRTPGEVGRGREPLLELAVRDPGRETEPLRIDDADARVDGCGQPADRQPDDDESLNGRPGTGAPAAHTIKEDAP